MAHTFEYDGKTIEFFPATVRTTLEQRRISRKLLAAYGYETSSEVPENEWDNMTDFAAYAAQTCVTDAVWWVNSMASLDDTRKAYEAFMAESSEFFGLLLIAENAVKPPKKTPSKTVKT